MYSDLRNGAYLYCKRVKAIQEQVQQRQQQLEERKQHLRVEIHELRTHQEILQQHQQQLEESKQHLQAEIDDLRALQHVANHLDKSYGRALELGSMPVVEKMRNIWLKH